MHIFGKGAGARGSDGGERAKQLLRGYSDCNQECGQKKVVGKTCQNKVCSIFDAD